MKKLGLLCVALAIAACNNDKVIDPFNSSNFYYVRLDPQASTIAQGANQQLTITAFDNGCTPTPTCNPLTPGNPVAVNGIARFRLQTAGDSVFATVDSLSGLLTAKTTTRTTPVTVNVVGRLQNIPGATSVPSVTLADTTPVTILAAGVGAPAVNNMTLSSSRATNGAGSADTLTVTYTDAGGATLATQRGATNSCATGVPCGTTGIGRPQFYSNDISVATVGATGIVTGVRPGTATITAANSVNGTYKTATFNITITDPVTATFNITTATSGSGIIFFPQTLTVSATEAAVEGRPCGATGQPACPNTTNPGAVVTWSVVGTTNFPNTFTATTTPNNVQCFNVTFANPTAAEATTTTGNSGNIGTGAAGSANAPLCNNGSQSRLFRTPGTYTFTSTTNGATGTLIVK
jgi:hypothetical protein